jgi:hypothetical protein
MARIEKTTAYGFRGYAVTLNGITQSIWSNQKDAVLAAIAINKMLRS